MKTSFKPKQDVVDELTKMDDEIDALLDDAATETSTSTNDAAVIATLQAQLQEAENARLRALADYQNLQRRTQADKAAWSKLATQDLIMSIVEPLEHLQLAADQLNDAGLTMVVKQLFDRLSDHGLQKIDALGKSFNPETMEAIEGSHPEGKKVSAVVRGGYTLNGILILPAKVKVG